MLYQSVLEVERENEKLREENEELKKLLGTEPPKPKNCRMCAYFIQHYVKSGSVYSKTNAGHCVHGKRTSSKKADEKGCQYFKLTSEEHFYYG
ncbi:MAG: hypothetical protein HFE90_08220 [Firmicutes bacterium]|nr:hypothetical protein [Bacillota bacterium]